MTNATLNAPRPMNLAGWLDTVLRDLKYTFRMLARKFRLDKV